ncbi:MAG TPA: hypothetical protein DCL49_06785, partial [Candidatus Omnitrophica bacterium]|nr:hypothetical protein [Candidatus Omnitrophota bacterium]
SSEYSRLLTISQRGNSNAGLKYGSAASPLSVYDYSYRGHSVDAVRTVLQNLREKIGPDAALEERMRWDTLALGLADGVLEQLKQLASSPVRDVKESISRSLFGALVGMRLNVTNLASGNYYSAAFVSSAVTSLNEVFGYYLPYSLQVDTLGLRSHFTQPLNKGPPFSSALRLSFILASNHTTLPNFDSIAYSPFGLGILISRKPGLGESVCHLPMRRAVLSSGEAISTLISKEAFSNAASAIDVEKAYVGTYYRALDTGYRIDMPEEFAFREKGGEATVYLIGGYHREYINGSHNPEVLQSKNRNVSQLYQARVDSKSRFVVPQELRNGYNWKIGTDIILIGAGKYFEIWRKKDYGSNVYYSKIGAKGRIALPEAWVKQLFKDREVIILPGFDGIRVFAKSEWLGLMQGIEVGADTLRMVYGEPQISAILSDGRISLPQAVEHAFAFEHEQHITLIKFKHHIKIQKKTSASLAKKTEPPPFSTDSYTCASALVITVDLRKSLSEQLEVLDKIWHLIHNRDENRLFKVREELRNQKIGNWLIEYKGYSPDYAEYYPGADNDVSGYGLIAKPFENITIDNGAQAFMLSDKIKESAFSITREFGRIDVNGLTECALHLVDNIEQHAEDGYGLIMLRSIIDSKSRKGIELTHLDDGRNLGSYSLSEEMKRGVTRKKGPGGYGLFKIAEFFDDIFIHSKREGEPAKSWVSSNPEREEITQSFLKPCGRLTIGIKWEEITKRNDVSFLDTTSTASPIQLNKKTEPFLATLKGVFSIEQLGIQIDLERETIAGMKKSEWLPNHSLFNDYPPSVNHHEENDAITPSKPKQLPLFESFSSPLNNLSLYTEYQTVSSCTSSALENAFWPPVGIRAESPSVPRWKELVTRLCFTFRAPLENYYVKNLLTLTVAGGSKICSLTGYSWWGAIAPFQRCVAGGVPSLPAVVVFIKKEQILRNAINIRNKEASSPLSSKNVSSPAGDNARQTKGSKFVQLIKGSFSYLIGRVTVEKIFDYNRRVKPHERFCPTPGIENSSFIAIKRKSKSGFIEIEVLEPGTVINNIGILKRTAIINYIQFGGKEGTKIGAQLYKAAYYEFLNRGVEKVGSKIIYEGYELVFWEGILGKVAEAGVGKIRKGGKDNPGEDENGYYIDFTMPEASSSSITALEPFFIFPVMKALPRAGLAVSSPLTISVWPLRQFLNKESGGLSVPSRKERNQGEYFTFRAPLESYYVKDLLILTVPRWKELYWVLSLFYLSVAGGETDFTAFQRGIAGGILIRAAAYLKPCKISKDKADNPMPGSSPLKVLFVDDDMNSREALCNLFSIKVLGAEILQAADAIEALGIVKADNAIDVLVTDVNMPGIDGIELVRRLREDGSKIPVIFMTGKIKEASARIEKETPEGKEAIILDKPFNILVLLHHIKTILNKSSSSLNDNSMAMKKIGLTYLSVILSDPQPLRTMIDNNNGEIIYWMHPLFLKLDYAAFIDWLFKYGTKKEYKFYTREKETILNGYQRYMETALAYVKGYPGPVFAAADLSSIKDVQSLFRENKLRGALVITKYAHPEPLGTDLSEFFENVPEWGMLQRALSVLGVKRITLIGELYTRRWWQIMHGWGCVEGARVELSGFSTRIKKELTIPYATNALLLNKSNGYSKNNGSVTVIRGMSSPVSSDEESKDIKMQQKRERDKRAGFIEQLAGALEKHGMAGEFALKLARGASGWFLEEEERRERLNRFFESKLITESDKNAVNEYSAEQFEAMPFIAQVRDTCRKFEEAGVSADKIGKTIALGYSYDAALRLAGEAGKGLKSTITVHILNRQPIGRNTFSEQSKKNKKENRAYLENALIAAGFSADMAKKIFLALRGYGLTAQGQQKRRERFINNRYLTQEEFEAIDCMDRQDPSEFSLKVNARHFATQMRAAGLVFSRKAIFSEERIQTILINGYSLIQVESLIKRYGKDAVAKALHNPDIEQALQAAIPSRNEIAHRYGITLYHAKCLTRGGLKSDAKIEEFLRGGRHLGLDADLTVKLFIKYRFSEDKIKAVIARLAQVYSDTETAFRISSEQFQEGLKRLRGKMSYSATQALKEELKASRKIIPKPGITKSLEEEFGKRIWSIVRLVLDTVAYSDDVNSKKSVYRPITEDEALWAYASIITRSRTRIILQVQENMSLLSDTKKQIKARKEVKTERPKIKKQVMPHKRKSEGTMPDAPQKAEIRNVNIIIKPQAIANGQTLKECQTNNDLPQAKKINGNKKNMLALLKKRHSELMKGGECANGMKTLKPEHFEWLEEDEEDYGYVPSLRMSYSLNTWEGGSIVARAAWHEAEPVTSGRMRRKDKEDI